MKNISSRIAVATSGIFITVGFLSENVKAVTVGSITGDANEFSWTIEAKDLVFDAPNDRERTLTFTPPDFTFWRASLNVKRFRNTIISITGEARHLSKPPGDDHNLDSETGNPFSFNHSEDFLQELVTHPSGETVDGHSDLFSLSFPLPNSNPNESTYTITGKHQAEPVPEPLTILGSAMALGFGGLFKKEYSKKQKKVKGLDKQKA
jgi:hypothetical protein